MRRTFPLLAVGLLIVVCLFLFFTRQPTPTQAPTSVPPLPIGPALTPLAEEPDWSELDPFQENLSFADFKEDLTSIYTLPGAWESTIALHNESAGISHHRGPDAMSSTLIFAPESRPLEPLPPLDEIHIAIDPGHIGGVFAKLEERNFRPEPSKVAVREGDLTLATAKHLKPLLEALGAKVTLVREGPEPVTLQRPKDFLPNFPDRDLANKLFYRTAEIRDRALLINGIIQPDLILCLHYNAEAWSNPDNPWTTQNHFHIILHGAFMTEELQNDDQRFELVRNLLSRGTRRAMPLAQTLSDVFLRETDLTPFSYRSTAAAIRLDKERPIFARNLIANRLYEAPSIYLEPYIMNNREVFERVQRGDYEGYQDVDGVPRRSLVREYAETVALGISEHYQALNSN